MKDRRTDDAALAARLAAGDEAALAEVYDRHGPEAYALAYALVRDPETAEDVVAEAFWQLWCGAHAYDPSRGSLGAWLCTLVRSRALDRLRSERRRSARQERAGPAPPPVDPPEEAVEQSERAERVRAALAASPEPQRRVIELAYFEGLTQTEIAARLAAPLGTVKTRLRLALEMRQALGRGDGGPT